MIRCVLAAALAAAALPAAAQRNFPANALRGELVVTAPPQAVLNGQPTRLAPGARIRDGQNLLQLSGAVVGQRLLVHYTRDNLGQPLEIWILTPAEAARQPWPVSDLQARTWAFDPSAQQWVKP